MRYGIILALCFSACCAAQNRNEPLLIVQKGKYGYIDHEGKVVIRPQFIWADDFWHGLATAYVCGRAVSVDTSGNLLPFRTAIDGQLKPREAGEKSGFIDASGQFRIAPIFDEVLPFSEGLAAVRDGEKWGFIDTSGHLVISPKFKAAYYFREGVSAIESDAGDVLIDTSGKVLASGFNVTELVAEGRVPATRKEKSGYLDLLGKIAIPLVYDGVMAFSEGLAAVEKGNVWGYVNRDGKVIIPPKFDRAGQFSSGLAPVKLGKHTGFINKNGDFAFSLQFDYAPGFLTGDEESGLFIAPSDVSRFWTADGRFGYVNTSGRVIWGPVKGSPDHPPLFGWSDEDKDRSCEGVSAQTRAMIAGFPD